MKKDWNIRTIYLYLVSFTTLIMIIIGTINFISTGVNLIFPIPEPVEDMPYMEKPNSEAELSPEEAERRARLQRERYRQEERNRNLRRLVTHATTVIVAAPIYLYHWRLIRRDEGSKESWA